MITPIFRTDRSPAGYNLSVKRDADGKMHVAIDAGSAGMAIVLTDDEETAFSKALGAQQTDGIPPHEVTMCGNGYLAAERALRVIEHATKLGEAMSADAIEHVHNLASEAGAACNRAALSRDAFADNIPF